MTVVILLRSNPFIKLTICVHANARGAAFAVRYALHCGKQYLLDWSDAGCRFFQNQNKTLLWLTANFACVCILHSERYILSKSMRSGEREAVSNPTPARDWRRESSDWICMKLQNISWFEDKRHFALTLICSAGCLTVKTTTPMIPHYFTKSSEQFPLSLMSVPVFVSLFFKQDN